jgi:hypothetical protein
MPRTAWTASNATPYDIADVASGVGLVAAAAGTWILLSTRASQSSAKGINVRVAGTTLNLALTY